jgi:hypothetical protein
MRLSSPNPSPIAPALFAALLCLAAACGGNKHIIEFDNRFSMNVVKTPHWFPDKKMPLTEAEQEVLFRNGPPDLIRFWWKPDGSIITTSDLTGKADEMPRLLQETRKSWIYLGAKEEIVFRGDGAWDREPLGELIEMICTYGDPSSRGRPILRSDGHTYETWQWIEHGMQVEMIDGKVGTISHPFPATGSGTWGLK